MNDSKDKSYSDQEEQEEGKPLFYNFWGKNLSKWAFILIVIIFLARVSLKTCDSPYVVPSDPDAIKLID